MGESMGSVFGLCPSTDNRNADRMRKLITDFLRLKAIQTLNYTIAQNLYPISLITEGKSISFDSLYTGSSPLLGASLFHIVGAV
jgi:hypothetical protein